MIKLIGARDSRRALALITCLAISNVALSKQPLDQTIQTLQNEWASAYNRRDTEALATLYAKDAILVPPGGKPVEGRSNILDFLASIYPQIRGLTLHTENVHRLGESHAVEIGYNTYDAVQDDGSMIRRSDNYVVVWRQDESGAWRYLREILNQRSTGSDQ